MHTPLLCMGSSFGIARNLHVYMCVYVSEYVYVYMYMYMNAYPSAVHGIQLGKCTKSACIYVCVNIHTHTFTYIHARTHTHTHTHTHTTYRQNLCGSTYALPRRTFALTQMSACIYVCMYVCVCTCVFM